MASEEEAMKNDLLARLCSSRDEPADGERQPPTAPPKMIPLQNDLLVRNRDGAVVDCLDDIVRIPAFDVAASGLRRAKNLLDGPDELTGHRTRTHDPRDGDDLGERDVSGVLNVLDLLAVTLRLLEGLDDQGRRRRDDPNLSLPVLADQLHGDTKALPLLGGLGNIITDLLRRHTQRTNLGG